VPTVTSQESSWTFGLLRTLTKKAKKALRGFLASYFSRQCNIYEHQLNNYFTQQGNARFPFCQFYKLIDFIVLRNFVKW
jgi:hypothetical protein